MDMLKINLNAFVFVKIKPEGLKMLEEYCDRELDLVGSEEIAEQYPTNEEGYTRFQGFELIHIFKEPSDRYIAMEARVMPGFTEPLTFDGNENTHPVTEIKVFDGRTFGFFGNPKVVCKCMSNGRKCNQRGMSPIEDEPWIQVGKDGNICRRVWRELPDAQ